MLTLLNVFGTVGFAEVKKRVRTTSGGSTGSVRNLRIREDTAKYLLNLNTDSAYYDPKSRCVCVGAWVRMCIWIWGTGRGFFGCQRGVNFGQSVRASCV